jgi:hypothetical protein
MHVQNIIMFYVIFQSFTIFLSYNKIVKLRIVGGSWKVVVGI